MKGAPQRHDEYRHTNLLIQENFITDEQYFKKVSSAANRANAIINNTEKHTYCTKND